jgi:hypothetical protein
MRKKLIKNITIIEIMVVGGGDMVDNGNVLATSKSKFSLPDASDNSLLGKPTSFPTGIRGGLKIIPCEIDETIDSINSTVVAK